MTYLLFFIFALLGSFVSLFGQDSDDRATVYANLISQYEIEKNIRVLASDGLEGEKTGEKGQKMAAFFIRDQFIMNAMQPLVATNLGKTYFQQFELENSSIADFHLLHNNHKIMDLMPHAYSDIEAIEKIDLVFYENLSAVPQKLAQIGVVMPFPNDKKLTDAFWSEEYANLAADLKKRGARMLFFAVKDKEKFAQTQKMFNSNPNFAGAQMRLLSEEKMGIALLGNDGFQQIFSVSIEEAITKKNIKNETVKVSVNKKSEVISTENVLGYIEGAEFPDEVLVITCHYDHLGFAKDGSVYNGADDNASGVAGMLEVMKAFGKAKMVGDFPKRSILFVALSAEEQGMLGSEFYTDYKPLFELKNTVANLNIDMIGREHTDSKFTANNYVSLVGSDWLSNDLHAISEKANKNHVGLQFDYTYNDKKHPERYFYRSDQYNFAKYNIPVIFYTGPDHNDYHQVTDDADLILFDRVEKVAKLIFFTAWEIVNREKRLSIDVK